MEIIRRQASSSEIDFLSLPTIKPQSSPCEKQFVPTEVDHCTRFFIIDARQLDKRCHHKLVVKALDELK